MHTAFPEASGTTAQAAQADGSVAETVGARSAATEGAGPCSVGTVISTFATSDVVVISHPPVSSSGNQSMPSTVTRVEVAVRAAGRGTPQRTETGGSPYAAVRVLAGSTSRRSPTVDRDAGSASVNAAHARAADASGEGLGTGTATGREQAERTAAQQMSATSGVARPPSRCESRPVRG